MSAEVTHLVERHRGAEMSVRPRHDPLFTMINRGITDEVSPLERESIPEMEPPAAAVPTDADEASAGEEFPISPPQRTPTEAGLAPGSPVSFTETGAPAEPQKNVAHGHASEKARTTDRSQGSPAHPPDWPGQQRPDSPTFGEPQTSLASEKPEITPIPGFRSKISPGQGPLPGQGKKGPAFPPSPHPPEGEPTGRPDSPDISVADSPRAFPPPGEFEPAAEDRNPEISPVRPTGPFRDHMASFSGVPDTTGSLSSDPPPPKVQISIGRIEVRLITPPASPPPPRRTAPPEIPVSLEDYLKSRQGGS